MTTSQVRLERRAGQRFDYQLPLSIRMAGAVAEQSGFTQDLSSKGVFLYTDFPLEQGALVELTLVMPSEITLSENMRVRCTGRVLRVVKTSSSQKIGAAVHLESYEYLHDPLTTSRDYRHASVEDAVPDEDSLVPRL